METMSAISAPSPLGSTPAGTANARHGIRPSQPLSRPEGGLRVDVKESDEPVSSAHRVPGNGQRMADKHSAAVAGAPGQTGVGAAGPADPQAAAGLDGEEGSASVVGPDPSTFNGLAETPPDVPQATPADSRSTVWRQAAGRLLAAVTSERHGVALYEEAVRLHSRRLIAIARAIVGGSAEDVVQQALTNLFQHRARYDWGNPAAAGALLRRAVVNESLRLLRQPRMSACSNDLPDHRPDAGGIERLIDAETVSRVRKAIARLPEHFRAALVLCEYEGMSYVQIAEVLGASVPQVKTWLHRARRQLGGMLEDVGR